MIDPTQTLVTIGTTIATTLAAKGIEAPGKTLGQIWDIAIGNRIAAVYEKSKAKHNLNVEDFKSKLINNVSSIPKENIQDPKVSIIGPALEASKYYFDEEEIRDMFANLIASSMDSSYNGLVQHSFVEIIKQLSPHDAKLFKSFASTEAFVSLVKINSEGHSNTCTDKLYINSDFSNYHINEISMDNLIRLGLIETNDDLYLTDDSLYNHYSKIAPVYTPLKAPRNSIVCIKKFFKITSLGKAFKKVSIKDSL